MKSHDYHTIALALVILIPFVISIGLLNNRPVIGLLASFLVAAGAAAFHKIGTCLWFREQERSRTFRR